MTMCQQDRLNNNNFNQEPDLASELMQGVPVAEQHQVTALNWGYPPYNRWSFQHVQQLFPTARLKKGEGASIPLRTSDNANVEQLVYTSPDGCESSIEQMLERSYTDAFVVLKAGQIVSEQYFNGMGEDSHHLMNSVTKSFVGMLAGVVVAQGLLDPDKPVTDYIPEFEDTALCDATVRQVLDMTAGIKYLEDYADPETDFWIESAVVGWRPALAERAGVQSLFDYVRTLQGKDQADGEKFHYRTVLTNVLGMLLERATGRQLSELLETEIWSKLGTEQDAAVVVDRNGFPYVGAGMNACARDLVRFGQMMLKQGRFNGQQIIPSEWIEDTRFADADTAECFANGEYGEALPGWHYRNQVWVKDADKGVMLALGIHGQIIYMDISRDVVIVKLSSQPESVDLDMYLDTFAALDAISTSLA